MHRSRERHMCRSHGWVHAPSRKDFHGLPVAVAQVAVLLELADRVELASGERAQLGVERAQLRLGLALAAAHREELAVLDVADPRADGLVARVGPAADRA